MRYQVTDLISEGTLISETMARQNSPDMSPKHNKKVPFAGMSSKFVLAIIGNMTKHRRAEITYLFE